jgi:hypothetical protein
MFKSAGLATCNLQQQRGFTIKVTSPQLASGAAFQEASLWWVRTAGLLETESSIEPKISAYHFLAHGFGDHRLLQQIRFIDHKLCLVKSKRMRPNNIRQYTTQLAENIASIDKSTLAWWGWPESAKLSSGQRIPERWLHGSETPRWFWRGYRVPSHSGKQQAVMIVMGQKQSS